MSQNSLLEAQKSFGQLPRAIDVQRFAGAREQEIRALCTALQSGPFKAKFGVAALPRHLRRRAGSHKPYNHRRYRPNAKLAAKRRKVEPAGNAAEQAGSGATGEAPAGDAAAAAAVAARPFTNRRMRRQPAALQERFRQAAAWTEASLAASGADGGGAAAPGSASSARRLETHVWHAKRLAMEERYGWLLPAGAAGRGRGSRSFVHTSQASALMHDTSYLCPLLLRGAWHSVHSTLSALLDPAHAATLVDCWADCGPGGDGSDGGSGGAAGWEQQLVLHQPECFPRGAICPAQILLCSSGGGSGGGAPLHADAAAAEALLWVHPAAAADAAAAIRAACDDGASLVVLNLRRMELRGGAADAALAAALCGGGAASGSPAEQQPPHWEHAAARPGQASQQEGQQGPQRGPQVQLPALLAGLADGEAVQALLPDPRLCKPVALGSASAALLAQGCAPRGQPLQPAELAAAPLPLGEAEVSARRQRLRLRLLGLQDSRAATASLQQQQQEQQHQELEVRGWCPAVVVRHDPGGRGGIPGWSLILPPGWVAPFWLAAAYAGCKPVGQREWRWLHALQQAAFFPWDFPDTPAHAALMEQQHALRAAAAARRPRGKRGLSAPPPPPPWEQLLTGVGGGSGEEEAGDGLAGAGPGPGGEQAQEMDTDGGPGAAQPALFVARSYAAMAAALHCTAGGLASAAAPLPGPRPVAAALRQGLLTWRPAAPLGTGSSPGAAPAADRSPGSGRAGDRACCLLEATVQPIRKGTVGEGAALCFVAGAEAERRRLPLTALSPRQLRRRRREAEELEVALLEMGGDPEAAAALHPSPSTHLPGAHLSHPPGISGGGGGADVAEEQLRTFGWVVAEAPRGAPRRCGARAAVLAAAAWRLRSLQAVPGGRADDGAIEALARNPGSAVLYPVRLRLLVEEPAA